MIVQINKNELVEMLYSNSTSFGENGPKITLDCEGSLYFDLHGCIDDDYIVTDLKSLGNYDECSRKEIEHMIDTFNLVGALNIIHNDVHFELV